MSKPYKHESQMEKAVGIKKKKNYKPNYVKYLSSYIYYYKI